MSLAQACAQTARIPSHVYKDLATDLKDAFDGTEPSRPYRCRLCGWRGDTAADLRRHCGAGCWQSRAAASTSRTETQLHSMDLAAPAANTDAKPVEPLVSYRRVDLAVVHNAWPRGAHPQELRPALGRYRAAAVSRFCWSSISLLQACP